MKTEFFSLSNVKDEIDNAYSFNTKIVWKSFTADLPLRFDKYISFQEPNISLWNQLTF